MEYLSYFMTAIDDAHKTLTITIITVLTIILFMLLKQFQILVRAFDRVIVNVLSFTAHVVVKFLVYPNLDLTICLSEL